MPPTAASSSAASSLQQPFVDRLGVFATNIGNMLSDVGFNVIDTYLLCGGEEDTTASKKGTASTTSASSTSVRTFQDVWARCSKVHGEQRMNLIYYAVVSIVIVVVLKVLVELIKLFKSPAGVAAAAKKKQQQKEQQKQKAAASNAKKSPKEDPSSAADNKDAAADSSSSASPSSPAAAASTSSPTVAVTAASLANSDTYRFAKALIEEAQSESTTTTSTPSSQIFASSTNVASSSATIKAGNKTVFPSKVGVMMTSPCQQYWLISCRSTMEARVYPQNHKAQFLSKGADLSKKLFLSLGYVLGPVLGSTTTSPHTNSPAVDISVASFLASTPLSSINYDASESAGGSGKKGGGSATEGSASSDTLLMDGSSAYLVVGESQKDIFVILRLSTSAGNNVSGMADDADASLKSADSTSSRSGAAKALAMHYKSSPVRAEVLWMYRKPNHRLVWDSYRFGLFSSFSCAPTAKISFVSAFNGNSNRPLFGAGAGAEHNLLSSVADEHAYGSSYVSSSSSSSPANIADMLVFGNADDCSVEVVHRAHVGDGYELTPWGSYQSNGSADKNSKSGSGSAAAKKGGKGSGKDAGAKESNANPMHALYAEADADWHPQHLKAGQTYATRHKNTNKFSVGHSAAMLLSDPIIVCCGTFSTDPSITQLTLPRYPLSSGAAGPQSVKDLLATYAIDRFFPVEAMRPKAPSHSAHSVSMATGASSIAPQKMRIPKIVPAYLAELSCLVGRVMKSSAFSSSPSSTVSNAELLDRFIQMGSGSAGASASDASAAAFARSGFAVQQVALINPYQPASTLSYNAGAGCHRPSFCVVFCDNGCGFVFDVATYWDGSSGSSSSGGSSSVGGSGASNAQDVLHSYKTFGGVEGESGGNSNSKIAINPPRRAADRPIATFYDVAFARKEVKGAGAGAVIGGCDHLAVGVAGAGPHYGLRIALVNKARRAVSIFGTSTTATNNNSNTKSFIPTAVGPNGVAFVEAPLTDKLLAVVADGSSSAAPLNAESILQAATSPANLPPNTTPVTYTSAFSSAPSASPIVPLARWRDVHPLYNRYGELNTIEQCCFIQNGVGFATMGRDDGMGVLMHTIA